MSDLCHVTGKQGYKTRAAASKARRAVNSRLTSNRPPVTVYRCRACGQWHIGRER